MEKVDVTWKRKLFLRPRCKIAVKLSKMQLCFTSISSTLRTPSIFRAWWILAPWVPIAKPMRSSLTLNSSENPAELWSLVASKVRAASSVLLCETELLKISKNKNEKDFAPWSQEVLSNQLNQINWIKSIESNRLNQINLIKFPFIKKILSD